MTIIWTSNKGNQMIAEKMTVKQLKVKGYKEHHTSWVSGYMSRKSDPVVESYKGRFGEGYAVYSPSWQSTRFHHVTYYIKG